MFRLGGRGDNRLKGQYYLSFGRHYHIYFVLIPTLTHKYESLQVFCEIYSLRVCRVTNRSPNPSRKGYGPNKPKTINL